MAMIKILTLVLVLSTMCAGAVDLAPQRGVPASSGLVLRLSPQIVAPRIQAGAVLPVGLAGSVVAVPVLSASIAPEPGVTGGAALGAVLVFYTGLASAFSLALPLGGILGAFISVLLLYLFAVLYRG